MGCISPEETVGAPKPPSPCVTCSTSHVTSHAHKLAGPGRLCFACRLQSESKVFFRALQGARIAEMYIFRYSYPNLCHCDMAHSLSPQRYLLFHSLTVFIPILEVDLDKRSFPCCFSVTLTYLAFFPLDYPLAGHRFSGIGYAPATGGDPFAYALTWSGPLIIGVASACYEGKSPFDIPLPKALI